MNSTKLTRPMFLTAMVLGFTVLAPAFASAGQSPAQAQLRFAESLLRDASAARPYEHGVRMRLSQTEVRLRSRLSSKNPATRQAARAEMIAAIQQVWNQYRAAIGEYQRVIPELQQVINLERRQGYESSSLQARNYIRFCQYQIRVLERTATSIRSSWAARGYLW